MSDIELPETLVQLCKREALGQTLSEWGEFTYDEIVDALYEDDESVLEHEDFTRWNALEGFSNSELAEHIEGIKRAFCIVAISAIETERGF
jgi:hypothetical protein